MTTSVKHFLNLPASRKNKEAIFLGCGPSILDIDENFKNRLKHLDVWSSNSWIIHNEIIPDFYHVEVKAHRSGPIFKRLCQEKKLQYHDVNWIIDGTRPHLLDYVSPSDYPSIYAYAKYYRQEESGDYELHPQAVAVSNNASLTVILDMMARMNYEKIYFLGVDMYSSKYFWTDNADYDSVNIPDIIKSCKPDERPPDSNHPTQKLKDFIVEFGNSNNIEMINLSEKSLLASRMKTIQIGAF
ncbi:hypothetical protein OAA09_00275 [bacterium]|nr:hypothetical protein [bacterium]